VSPYRITLIPPLTFGDAKIHQLLPAQVYLVNFQNCCPKAKGFFQLLPNRGLCFLVTLLIYCQQICGLTFLPFVFRRLFALIDSAANFTLKNRHFNGDRITVLELFDSLFACFSKIVGSGKLG
jgi:hypothetical protein